MLEPFLRGNKSGGSVTQSQVNTRHPHKDEEHTKAMVTLSSPHRSFPAGLDLLILYTNSKVL